MNTTPRRTIFEVWTEQAGPDWQGLITALADEAWDERKPRAMGEASALVEKLEQIAPKFAIDLDNALLEVSCDARDFGVILGYAIAKTAPDGLAGLEDWLQRAIKYAGLENGPTKQEG